MVSSFAARNVSKHRPCVLDQIWGVQRPINACKLLILRLKKRRKGSRHLDRNRETLRSFWDSWLPPRDSNPDMPLQRRLSYH